MSVMGASSFAFILYIMIVECYKVGSFINKDIDFNIRNERAR